MDSGQVGEGGGGWAAGERATVSVGGDDRAG
jgi:hypothetical protein